MSGHRTIRTTVGRVGLPNELSLILQQYVLVRSFHEVTLYPQMRQYSQSRLRVPKGVSRHLSSGVIVELSLEEVQA